jgi:hypothetical protein
MMYFRKSIISLCKEPALSEAEGEIERDFEVAR